MPKVYISAAADFNLSSSDLSIKKELLKRVADENFDVQEFQGSGIPKGMRWSFEDAARIMDRCQGVLVLAQGRFTQHFSDMKGLGASEYCHYEGGLAIARGLPLLVLVGADVLPRGIAWTQGPHLSIQLPNEFGSPWRQEGLFRNSWNRWATDIRSRDHVFLGFCGKARPVANEIALWLQSEGLKVRSYAFDFQPGRTILDEIELARRTCQVGIFLFTKDDPIDSGGSDSAAPRDNVVFEAGYFMAARGAERTLIIREQGARMPADLGGSIYVAFSDRNRVSEIHTQVRKFLISQV
jgi:hypothetical protein